MANYDDDDLDNIEETEQEPEVVQEENRGGNRNFLIAVGIIAAIFVLLTIALVVVALLFLPRQRAQREATNAVILTQNVATAVFATERAQAAAQLLTPSATLTGTMTSVPPTATNTAVVAVASSTPTGTATAIGTVEDARTATVAALLTQAAAGKTGTVVTGTPGTAAPGATTTGLPQSGFAEDVGLPGLFGLAIGLVVVIVLARRLRLSPKG
jgi:hypothetical protein